MKDNSSATNGGNRQEEGSTVTDSWSPSGLAGFFARDSPYIPIGSRNRTAPADVSQVEVETILL